MKRADNKKMMKWHRSLVAIVVATIHFSTHAEEPGHVAQRFDPLLEGSTLDSRNSNLPDRPFNLLSSDERAKLLGNDDAILLGAQRESAPADGQSIVHLRVTLIDQAGNRIKRPVNVTIESTLGRVVTPNIVNAEKTPKFMIDRDRREPGVQSLIESGELDFTIIAPSEAGDATIRVTSGNIRVEGRVSFLPDLRSMFALGLVEGTIRHSKINKESLASAQSNDALEQELRTFARSHDPNDPKHTTLGGRAAMFAKGTVKDDYLLTFSYDSDKETRGRLFRDIQPDQFYPIYGDSSIKGFDAQSTQKLYLRVDKEKSNFLAGDFNTDIDPNQAKSLGRYSRSLTGVRQHYEKDRVVLNAFAARDNVKQIIDEQPGRGISGPYNLSTPNGLTNSEKVELITRDRNQAAVILRIQPLLRFEDYEFEPFSGRLLFRKPVPTVDENLNPISIRVTYEVEQGGPKFWVGGVDGQIKLTDRIEVGGSYVNDDNPISPLELASVNATIKLADKTFAILEVARTKREDANLGLRQSGNGYRGEIRHESGGLIARIFAGKTDSDFDNPAATLNKGRSEAGAKATYELSENTAIIGEILRTEDVTTGAERSGASLAISHKFNDRVQLDAGLRYSRDTVNPNATVPPNAGQTTCNNTFYTPGLTPLTGILACPFSNGPINGNEVTSARLRLTAKILEKASAYIEGEQDFNDGSKHAVAIGGEYQFLDQGRLYARHEYSRGLSGLYGLNGNEATHATVFGVDTAYMKDGQLFSEYRLRDAISGRDAEAATGLRNLWRMSDKLAFSTNVERIHTLSGANHTATAVALGMEYATTDVSRFSGRLEGRTDDVSDSYLSTLAYTQKLDLDWSLLAKNYYTLTKNKDAALGEKKQDRAIVGVAYRQTDINRWNALARYEFKVESDTGLASPSDRTVHIGSIHANYKPRRSIVLSGQFASKLVDETLDRVNSRFSAHLLSGRLLYDVTERWDVGIQAATLLEQGGAKKYSAGVETGYAFVSNLWASIGFNFNGFSDPDLVESDYTRRGIYLRLRYKFDETTFSTRQASRN